MDGIIPLAVRIITGSQPIRKCSSPLAVSWGIVDCITFCASSNVASTDGSSNIVIEHSPPPVRVSGVTMSKTTAGPLPTYTRCEEVRTQPHESKKQNVLRTLFCNRAGHVN